MDKRKKRVRKILIVLAILIIVLFGGFYIYTSDYYRADEYAVQIFTTVATNVQETDIIVIYPDKQTNSKVGLIFYPGGKVEATAYLPLLEKISEEGITCILLKMPFNLAVFDVNAADKVYDKFPNIERWYLGGHSLGGAMASSYAGKNSEKLDGLILLGAYPINNAKLPTIAIYGSEEEGLDKTKLEGIEDILEIIGGNHAYFGNYGEQRGDGVASISREEQQERAVDAIMEFIRSK